MSSRAKRGICCFGTCQFIAVIFTGCYGYIAPPPGVSLAGREAQLSLSDSGAVILAPSIGPTAEAIMGRVITDTGTTYVLSLTTVRRRDGGETSWRREVVTIPRALVTDAGERRFSPSRTALVGGIVSASLVAARLAFGGRGSAGGGGAVGHSGGFQ